jgi:outer membrane protein
MKKFLVFIFINSLLFFNISYADNVYFIDFTKVLNQSLAGAEAQKKLQDKFQQENNRFIKEEQKLKKTESDLISQKKVFSNEEYQKKVQELRNQVSKLQKDKLDTLNSIAESRNKAKKKLLDIVNPIIKKYMEDNGIRLVIDKQGVILGDTKLELTEKIIEILNKELKTLNIN